MDIPLGLQGPIETGNVVLFLGSGVGHHMFDKAGKSMPDGHAMAVALRERFGIDSPETDLAKISQIVEIRHGRRKLVQAVSQLLSGFEPDEDLQWLLSQTWRAVFTTNYDSGIERCFELNPSPKQLPVSIAANQEYRHWNPVFEVPVVHLHGAVVGSPRDQDILITQQDYAKFSEQRSMLFDLFKLEFASSPILYIGYANADPNWAEVVAELRRQFQPSEPPRSYRVAPTTPDLDREILSHQSIETLDGAIPDLRAAIWAQLGEFSVVPANLDALRARIPSQLHGVFSENPSALTRLLGNWEYVNQADFTEPPNTSSFHKGDRANWGVIGSGVNFERDLERPVLDDLIEYATSSPSSPRAALTLGPAGYGVSTFLLAVAAWYVKSGGASVLLLRQSGEISEGDVRFAVENLPGPVVFIVDDAVDQEQALYRCMSDLRARNDPGYFLLGGRLNEWRQRRTSLRPVEFQLEPLSDEEIFRLIASLKTTSGLGKLADLSEEHQFVAIKHRNQQELLVTMREATEGKSFDAIIEDEFRGIANDDAAAIYALVCVFSRLRAIARDMLIAEALKIDHASVFRLVGDYLEGIVAWEIIDDDRGIDGLRARHRTIAEIVWDRSIDPARRERVLLAAIGALNLAYGVDAKAFEALTRDDASIDSLGSLEAKTRFFEGAIRKAPADPFVKQHYARMLRREQKLDLALGQIDSAITDAPTQRSLHHTRGLILRDMALDAAGTEFGRRRLAQAEESFERSIALNEKDDYGHQSIADLYLEWAKRVEDPRESIVYVAKAQEAVARGLAKASQAESLYVTESQIHRFLGDAPARIQALVTALEQSPTSSIVRYLLGSAYQLEGNYPKAQEVLEEGVLQHPEDPRLSLAYARALYKGGSAMARCLAVLALNAHQGLKDPAYVATYGGLLFLDGQLDAAKDIWNRAAQGMISPADQKRTYFRPFPETLISGVVREARPHFAFISVVGVGDYFCSASRMNGETLSNGTRVEFLPGFNSLGPVVSEGLRIAKK